MKVLILLLAVAVVSTKAASISKTRCPALCFIYCPFGNVMDENGCATCKCHWEPQTTKDTAPATTCTPVLCEIFCPHGLALDAVSGCPRCGCNDAPTE